MMKPITTLFMLQSLDGKISTGSSDDRDFDSDLINIDGVKEGLHQYYEIEKTTDEWSLCTGKTQAKIGVNYMVASDRRPVSFCILDSNYLTKNGVRYLCQSSKFIVLVTTNPSHPAFEVDEENLHVIFQHQYNLYNVFDRLKRTFGCCRITVQSGGNLNSFLIRNKFIDQVDIVVAPLLVGGVNTASLIGGSSLETSKDLKNIGILKLKECKVLKNSYVRLRYDVVK